MTETLGNRAWRAGAATAWWLIGRRAVHGVTPKVVRVTPTATPRAPLVAVATSIALVMLTASLGASAAVQPWPGSPPFASSVRPNDWVVTALLAAATVIGTYGLLGCLAALTRGWAPDPRILWLGSTLVVVAMVLLPPVGSADPGSYVGYGRLAATGHDPYVTPPSILPGEYGAVVEAPWRTTTSVYGPIATGEQWLAVKLAGDGPHAAAHAVFALDVVNGLAFVITGLLLYIMAGTKPGRRRVGVLFGLNPLLLFVGVASEHLDVIVALFAVGAVAAACRSRRFDTLGTFIAGVLAGAAAAVKASAALVGAGIAWALVRDSRRPAGAARYPTRRLLALLAGAAAVLVPGYVLAGWHAFDQLRHASGFVSFADPWRLVTHPLEVMIGRGPARAVVRAAAWAAFAVLALLLDRGLPGRREAGVAAVPMARAALVCVLAWLLTAPYVLPWYGVVAFALLSLIPASGYDTLLVSWTAVLALAYLPGRQVALPGWLHHVLDGWKSGIAPVALCLVAITAAVMSMRRRG